MNKIASILLCLLLIAGNALAQSPLDKIVNRGTLKVGVTGNQPPFSLTKSDGSMIGFEIDLANRLATEMGVRAEFVKLSFDNLMNALATDQVDVIMSGMTMTTARNTQVAFVGPYIVSGKSILSKSVIFTNKENSMELNRKKMTIATMAGTTSEDYVRENYPSAKVTTVSNYDEAVDLILKNKADVMISDYAECVFASFKYQDKNLKVMKDLLETEPIGMAVKPDLLMLNLLENFLKNMDETGDLEDLEAKWFRSGSWFAELD